jgi:hypothetical protein
MALIVVVVLVLTAERRVGRGARIAHAGEASPLGSHSRTIPADIESRTADRQGLSSDKTLVSTAMSGE